MAEPRSGGTPRGCAAPKGAPIHKPTLPSVETLGYDLPSRVLDSIIAVYPRCQRRELIIKPQTKKLSHYDADGRASMVDVSDKQPSVREAEASAFVAMSAEVLRALPQNPKGDPLEVARIAGIQAAKRTSELIPMCHPIPLSKVDVQAKVERDGIAIRSLARTTAVTGVEMEALVAASVAALTVYDMCKALDKSIAIREIVLLRKSGGKSGDYQRPQPRSSQRGASQK